jgi:pimeloyl-ACP methyl ester carboxylesterase
MAGHAPHRGQHPLVGDPAPRELLVHHAPALALERGATPETPPPVLAFLKTWEPDRNDALAVVAVLRRPPNPTFTDERLQGIRAPVLIVNGDSDPVMQLGSRLTSSLANVRCVTLPGVDHLGLPAQPAFIRHAVEFLA